MLVRSLKTGFFPNSFCFALHNLQTDVCETWNLVEFSNILFSILRRKMEISGGENMSIFLKLLLKYP